MKPEIVDFPFFLDSTEESEVWQRQLMLSIFQALVPDETVVDPSLIEEKLPLITSKQDETKISFYMISPFRSDIPKFVYDVLSKWIQTNRGVAIESFHSIRFKFHELESGQYIALSTTLNLAEANDREMLLQQMPIMQKEIALGLRSLYHARKILEIKGFSREEKISAMQEKITELVHRFPDSVDYDIFHLLQRCIVTTQSSFIPARSHKHLTKIISVLYVFLQRLLQERVHSDRRRDLHLKITRSEIEAPFGKKEVLSFYVGLQFLKENERFSKEHLLKAVKRYLPNTMLVEDSFFEQKKHDDLLSAFYVEMVKKDGSRFTDNEIALLNSELSNHLKGCIERLVRPIVMPRNEEEVMKYVLVLAGQLKSMRDIPQMVIIFNEQTDIDLYFTVVIARALLPDSRGIGDLLIQKEGVMEMSVEKVKQMGLVRKKFPKEVAILKLRLSNIPFLREDYAVDVYLARQKVSHYLEEMFGEFRDYNGGMISKQMEVLGVLKESLPQAGVGDSSLVENFFHSLYPIEMRSVVHPEFMQTFYCQFQKLFHRETDAKYFLEDEEKKITFLIRLQDAKKKDELMQSVQKLDIPSVQLLTLHLQMQDIFFLGYLYFFEEDKEREVFIENLLEHLS